MTPHSQVNNRTIGRMIPGLKTTRRALGKATPVLEIE
jgi:hypothetical protein